MCALYPCPLHLFHYCQSRDELQTQRLIVEWNTFSNYCSSDLRVLICWRSRVGEVGWNRHVRLSPWRVGSMQLEFFQSSWVAMWVQVWQDHQKKLHECFSFAKMFSTWAIVTQTFFNPKMSYYTVWLCRLTIKDKTRSSVYMDLLWLGFLSSFPALVSWKNV